MRGVEYWRAVVGFEDTYEVSSLGRVRSIDRVVTRTDGRVRRFKGKILSTNLGSRKRYECVTLHRRGGWRKNVRVHVIVLEAFAGPRPGPQYETRHIDGNALNNKLGNLAWGTAEENSADRVAHKRLQRAQRASATLTAASAVAIRELAPRITQRQLAEIFCVTQQTISDVVRFRSWKDVHVVG